MLFVTKSGAGWQGEREKEREQTFGMKIGMHCAAHDETKGDMEAVSQQQGASASENSTEKRFRCMKTPARWECQRRINSREAEASVEARCGAAFGRIMRQHASASTRFYPRMSPTGSRLTVAVAWRCLSNAGDSNRDSWNASIHVCKLLMKAWVK